MPHENTTKPQVDGRIQVPPTVAIEDLQAEVQWRKMRNITLIAQVQQLTQLVGVKDQELQVASDMLDLAHAEIKRLTGTGPADGTATVDTAPPRDLPEMADVDPADLAQPIAH